MTLGILIVFRNTFSPINHQLGEGGDLLTNIKNNLHPAQNRNVPTDNLKRTLIFFNYKILKKLFLPEGVGGKEMYLRTRINTRVYMRVLCRYACMKCTSVLGPDVADLRLCTLCPSSNGTTASHSPPIVATSQLCVATNGSG